MSRFHNLIVVHVHTPGIESNSKAVQGSYFTITLEQKLDKPFHGVVS